MTNKAQMTRDLGAMVRLEELIEKKIKDRNWADTPETRYVTVLDIQDQLEKQFGSDDNELTKHMRGALANALTLHGSQLTTSTPDELKKMYETFSKVSNSDSEELPKPQKVVVPSTYEAVHEKDEVMHEVYTDEGVDPTSGRPTTKSNCGETFLSDYVVPRDIWTDSYEMCGECFPGYENEVKDAS